MNEAEQILVVILSGALSVFLILGIIALVLLIKVLNSVKRLASKAEEVGEVIEGSVKSLTNLKFISSITEIFANRTRAKRRK